MLNWIKIKNLALIEHSEVEFGRGFNVITGETGAGKSVLLGTINLLLGARADKGVIRSGAERCDVSAGISLSPETYRILKPVLAEAEIPVEEESPELQIRRVISLNQTKNLINDTPVTLQTLKNIGEKLVDVHAANEHQSLFSQSCQLEMLDRYSRLEKQAQECVAVCEEIKALQATRNTFFKDLPSAIEAEHLRLTISDIERAAPEPGEDERLSARHRVAANARQIMEHAAQSVQLLNESENSMADQLATVYHNLQELEKNDPEKGREMLQTCDQVSELLRDLAGQIEDYSGRVELDGQEFMELEARMSTIQNLKRRYGPGLDNVLENLEKARLRLELFSNAEKKRLELDAEEQALRIGLRKAAEKLSAARKKSAETFQRKVVEKLKSLGFLRSALNISFAAIEPGEKGMDRIDFMFSANPGEEVQPLRNIASSGEISRVMLALKTVLADADSIPILVFDEIDVNIGGETANQVGLELKELGRKHQVLCISHLAQVAAQSDAHYMVQKEVAKGRTCSRIALLDDDARIKELGRMLGGGKAAAAHARELITTNINI